MVRWYVEKLNQAAQKDWLPSEYYFIYEDL
jgi:hypothetical protein